MLRITGNKLCWKHKWWKNNALYLSKGIKPSQLQIKLVHLSVTSFQVKSNISKMRFTHLK